MGLKIVQNSQTTPQILKIPVIPHLVLLNLPVIPVIPPLYKPPAAPAKRQNRVKKGGVLREFLRFGV
jgi:hypothetical protein